ncbi:MAG TPA: zinc-ribbon domain-containing protein [Blastocatellia bacterium]|nr:zinc-ribbon domain-containing protein [Blastocatellia bacterium]
MPSWCPSCGRQVEEDEKFCRQCGMPQHLTGEEATTWMLTPPTSETNYQTARVKSDTSPARPPTGAAYIPPTPAPYYQPPFPSQYEAPAQTGQPHIALGDWLSGGWQVYKENWALMSLASLLGGTLSVVSIGILAGPLLMGMFRMAFKTLKGERPWMSDLFNWQGSFLQAFLAFLIFAVVHGVTRIGNGAINALLSFFVSPFLTVMLGLTMSLITERGLDVLKAINEVWRLVFSRDALMWWVVGLVFATISFGGIIACGIGLFVTLPWIISATAVAHRDVFGMDDPNRTLH